MMTRPIKLSAPRRKSALRPTAGSARFPHPSWRLSGDAEAAGKTLSAEDFWQKLGL